MDNDLIKRMHDRCDEIKSEYDSKKARLDEIEASKDASYKDFKESKVIKAELEDLNKEYIEVAAAGQRYESLGKNVEVLKQAYEAETDPKLKAMYGVSLASGQTQLEELTASYGIIFGDPEEKEVIETKEASEEVAEKANGKGNKILKGIGLVLMGAAVTGLLVAGLKGCSNDKPATLQESTSISQEAETPEVSHEVKPLDVEASATAIYDSIKDVKGLEYSQEFIEDMILIANGESPKNNADLSVSDLGDFLYNTLYRAQGNAVNAIAGVEPFTSKPVSVPVHLMFAENSNDYNVVKNYVDKEAAITTTAYEAWQAGKDPREAVRDLGEDYLADEYHLFIKNGKVQEVADCNLNELSDGGIFVAGFHVLATNAELAAIEQNLTIEVPNAVIDNEVEYVGLEAVTRTINPSTEEEAEKSTINTSGRALEALVTEAKLECEESQSLTLK